MRLVILSLALLLSCVQKSRRIEQDSAPSQGVVTNAYAKSSGLNLSAKDAQVSVSLSGVKVQNWGKDYKLPYFHVSYKGSEFVRILRCDQSYLEYFSALLTAAQATKSVSKQKQLWLDSFGATNFCRISANFTNASEYYDINAKNGTFFYIVNPCVSRTKSDNGIEECSYRLVATPTITYTESIANSFAQLAVKLSDAESAYDAHLTNLLNLAAKLDAAKETCNDALYARETMNNIQTRNWNIINLAASAGIGLSARALLTNSAAKSFTGRLAGFGSAIKNTAPGARWGFAGMIFAAVYGILSGIQAGTQTPDKSVPDACKDAEKVSEDLLALRDQRPTLEDLEYTLIQISEQMHAIESQFIGYTEDTFGYKSE